MRRKTLFILLTLWLLNLSAGAQTDTILLGGTLNQYVTYSPPYLKWTPAEGRASSFDGARKLLSENKFNKWTQHSAFTQGITGKAFWLAVKVYDTSASEQYFLWSFYTTSCKYDYYELDSGYLLLNQYHCSTFQPISKRPYPVRSISFPFITQGGDTRILMVKVQATNTDLLYADQDISTPEDFLLWEIGYTGLMNRYFGSFLFTLLANLFLFFFMRKKIYGWLSLYIAFLLVYNINDFCFDALIFPDWFFKYEVLIPKFTWVMGATFSSLMVFNLFTEQRTIFPKWFFLSRLFIRALQILTILSISLHLLVQDPQDRWLVAFRFASYLILAASMLFQFLNLIFLSLKKQRAGLFFLLSSGPLIFSAMAYFYYMFSGVNLIMVLPGNVINACFFEIVLLTIIFIYDYRNRNKDHRRLLNELLLSERRINQAILNTQEQERKRFAIDLHDELGSNLAALKLKLQNTKFPEPDKEMLLKMVDKASRDTRHISHNLMPPEFENTSLDDLLRNYFTGLFAETSIHFNYLSTDRKELFTKDEELIIYRIIMELTGNILKHADAKEVTIQLVYHDTHLAITVEDNGKGMQESESTGIGLKNVRSRTDYLNGHLNIDSNEWGTTVVVLIPYRI